MATTTNYGWTTPDDTALVKDGASAIRTLGTSVDTTTKNLNPQTTLGDIAYRSSTSNVNTRLGIGTTGQVLTVAAGVPSWATPAASANFTEVNAGGTNLTGASTITISGITNANFLQVIVRQAGSVNASSEITMRINADSGSNYYRIGNLINEEATIINRQESLTSTELFMGLIGVNDVDYISASATIIGGNSAGRKVVNVNGSVGTGYGSSKGCWYQGQWIGSATISSISILSSSGNFDGGKVYVYASA